MNTIFPFADIWQTCKCVKSVPGMSTACKCVLGIYVNRSISISSSVDTFNIFPQYSGVCMKGHNTTTTCNSSLEKSPPKNLIWNYGIYTVSTRLLSINHYPRNV